MDSYLHTPQIRPYAGAWYILQCTKQGIRIHPAVPHRSCRSPELFGKSLCACGVDPRTLCWGYELVPHHNLSWGTLDPGFGLSPNLSNSRSWTSHSDQSLERVHAEHQKNSKTKVTPLLHHVLHFTTDYLIHILCSTLHPLTIIFSQRTGQQKFNKGVFSIALPETSSASASFPMMHSSSHTEGFVMGRSDTTGMPSGMVQMTMQAVQMQEQLRSQSQMAELRQMHHEQQQQVFFTLHVCICKFGVSIVSSLHIGKGGAGRKATKGIFHFTCLYLQIRCIHRIFFIHRKGRRRTKRYKRNEKKGAKNRKRSKKNFSRSSRKPMLNCWRSPKKPSRLLHTNWTRDANTAWGSPKRYTCYNNVATLHSCVITIHSVIYTTSCTSILHFFLLVPMHTYMNMLHLLSYCINATILQQCTILYILFVFLCWCM